MREKKTWWDSYETTGEMRVEENQRRGRPKVRRTLGSVYRCPEHGGGGNSRRFYDRLILAVNRRKGFGRNERILYLNFTQLRRVFRVRTLRTVRVYVISFTACECGVFYSTGNCSEGFGKCECKPAYAAPDCDRCSEGYYGYPDCKPCDCFLEGTRNGQCENKGGQCPCKQNFGGKVCYQCADGFYDFPKCKRKRSHHHMSRPKIKTRHRSANGDSLLVERRGNSVRKTHFHSYSVNISKSF